MNIPTRHLMVGQGSRLPGRVALAAAIGLAGLAGCGQKAAQPGQSLVKVGGAEVTVHQLNDEMRRADVRDEAGKQKLLEQLVDRQLLVNEALRKELDRDPEVMRELERARAHVLSLAYLRRHAAPPAVVAEEEMTAFYHENEALFGGRRLFEIVDIVIAPKSLAGDLDRSIAGKRSPGEMTALLDKAGVAYQVQHSSRLSSDIPMALLPAMHKLKEGEALRFDGTDATVVRYVTQLREMPQPYTSARPQIEQYLANARQKQANEQEVARLRAAGSVTYLNPAMQVATRSIEGSGAVAPADAGTGAVRQGGLAPRQ